MKPFAPFLLLCFALPAFPQSPPTVLPPTLAYTLRIDTSDYSGYTVTIRIANAPHNFRLAMATHHEYDDRYWRYVRSFHAEPPASFTREDSAVWAVTTTGNDAEVSYRIQLPPPGPFHFSHRPFLWPNGGLVGDLHSFMYLVDYPHAACRLTLELPAGWRAASGLDVVPAQAKSVSRRRFPLEYVADSAAQLLDAPILVGRLHRWDFIVRGITHSVVYLPATTSPPIDSIRLIRNFYNIVRAAHTIFGGFPYRHYSFLLEDSSEGALEHGNSVTIGTPQGALSSSTSYLYEEVAHEFFHSWNLMAIRPAPYTDLNYGPQEASPGLWFSEGVTMFYADLICRRLHLPVEDSTRIAHLASLITRYYEDTGNAVFPPSRVSLASNMQPGPLGDYAASTHLQGELLADCLDMLIRDATDTGRSLDDVMKGIYERFGAHQPLHDSDIEAAATRVCQAGTVHAFFQDYVYTGKPIDFNRWLSLLGLRVQHDQVAATGADGLPRPDTRVYAWTARDDPSLRIGIINPNSCWSRAGLHTGDVIATINGRPVRTGRDFQTILAGIHVGDSLLVETAIAGSSPQFIIPITGYTTPVIHITQVSGATARQQRLLRLWLEAAD